MPDEAAQLERENQDSVEISRTAKGEVSFKVKCYAADGGDAMKRAQSLYDAMCRKFPRTPEYPVRPATS